MEYEKLFKKYYLRLAKEGFIKALICGCVIAFSISLVPAITAIVKNNFNLSVSAGFWISFGIFFVIASLATPLFYYLMFRPKTKQIAERIDRLGLDERLITMMELERDESYMAMRQREDAKGKLSGVYSNQLKFSVLKIPLIILFALAMLSITTITISAVGFEPKISWESQGDFVPTDPEEEYEYISIIYLADVGGAIDKNAYQLVVYGQDSSPVVAIANAGYAFSKWSDGVTTAERIDQNVKEEFFVTAVFVKVDETPDNEPSDGSDEQYNEVNNIIDNETYYRNVYELFYNQVIEKLTSGSEIPSDLRAFIEAYFGTIS